MAIVLPFFGGTVTGLLKLLERPKEFGQPSILMPFFAGIAAVIFYGWIGLVLGVASGSVSQSRILYIPANAICCLILVLYATQDIAFFGYIRLVLLAITPLAIFALCVYDYALLVQKEEFDCDGRTRL